MTAAVPLCFSHSGAGRMGLSWYAWHILTDQTFGEELTESLMGKHVGRRQETRAPASSYQYIAACRRTGQPAGRAGSGLRAEGLWVCVPVKLLNSLTFRVSILWLLSLLPWVGHHDGIPVLGSRAPCNQGRIRLVHWGILHLTHPGEQSERSDKGRHTWGPDSVAAEAGRLSRCLCTGFVGFSPFCVCGPFRTQQLPVLYLHLLPDLPHRLSHRPQAPSLSPVTSCNEATRCVHDLVCLICLILDPCFWGQDVCLTIL